MIIGRYCIGRHLPKRLKKRVEHRRDQSLIQAVTDSLQGLAVDASWQEIRQAINYVVAQRVPEIVYTDTVELFGDEESASNWLVERNLAFGDEAPVDVCKKENGPQNVLDLLCRIQAWCYLLSIVMLVDFYAGTERID